MVQRELALTCAVLLLWCSLAAASPASTEASGTKPASLKERLTLIPAGSIIEVKLANKHKVRGRLGAISDSGFELQHMRDNQVVTESLAFETVRSVRVMGKGMHFAAKVVIGTLIAMGVVALVGLIACATGGCSG
jgi:hypothetical protein